MDLKISDNNKLVQSHVNYVHANYMLIFTCCSTQNKNIQNNKILPFLSNVSENDSIKKSHLNDS